jgi:metal-responsive CopG/Arc/MetJ family transcriptional regulator
VAKLSISLSDSLAGFVENYRKMRSLRSRSQVFAEAIKLLQSRELEAAYQGAATQYDQGWETASSDGLANEKW